MVEVLQKSLICQVAAHLYRIGYRQLLHSLSLCNLPAAKECSETKQ